MTNINMPKVDIISFHLASDQKHTLDPADSCWSRVSTPSLSWVRGITVLLVLGNPAAPTCRKLMKSSGRLGLGPWSQ